jgi:hypothetical protein
MAKKGNCSIMPGNSAWIAERAGVRRYDFVENAQHFQVIPTKVGIQMFFFSVRLPSVIEQLQKKAREQACDYPVQIFQSSAFQLLSGADPCRRLTEDTR